MKKKSTVLSTTIASLTHKLSLSILLVASLASPSWANNNVAKNVAEIVNNPRVKDDRVTIRIKVKNSADRPVMGLEDTNFKLLVDEKEVPFATKDWKSPEETIPPPAWIIVLLDFSGSMNQLDRGGTKKITGAINAVRQFIQVLSQRGGDTQISIVPFGKSGSNCQGYPVNNETLGKFFGAKDFKLQNYLDYLAKTTPCASTDLYTPLNQAIRFFANGEDENFDTSENSDAPQPRRSIILLSDGYHNQINENQDFEALKKLLKNNPLITVHTLGYGLTPTELGQKYKLGRPANRADLASGKVPESEFVDQKRLQEIASLTGGITEFSGNAKAIAENLQLFLNALLGEYEITYTQPNAERGAKHDVQVVVNIPRSESVKSPPKAYRITVFGRSLPLMVRLIMLICVLLAMVFAGVLPFYFWGEALKQEALQD
ncbi:VWA domain-containing protein [Chrysosporum ovalisporum ANA283AFssAo]|uniref:vWA domain-containing protein n=1 Tax=Umezakia ovalisporum TaxID=75695 RepID=UPI002475454E|nr:vWA domain-containing protein [Umezakia ovalisporum]MDH6076563.1 VWA domain-containing protein [Umezakia ovalisporum FSS-45]MDH6102942.1 VWA domain-containing protein [Umezakia ovalisporum ANA283AFssAo]